MQLEQKMQKLFPKVIQIKKQTLSEHRTASPKPLVLKEDFEAYFSNLSHFKLKGKPQPAFPMQTSKNQRIIP